MAVRLPADGAPIDVVIKSNIVIILCISVVIVAAIIITAVNHIVVFLRKFWFALLCSLSFALVAIAATCWSSAIINLLVCGIVRRVPVFAFAADKTADGTNTERTKFFVKLEVLAVERVCWTVTSRMLLGIRQM